MAAAVPFALKAAPMVAGMFMGKKTSGANAQQKAAMTGTQQAATSLGQMGGPLVSQGTAMSRAGGTDLDAAGNYYRNILSSRQAGRESLAPEMGTAMEFYRGAAQKAGRTLRGGERDYGLAELDRQKVAQMAGMLPAARRGAAEGLGQIGGTRMAGGASMTGQGVNAASNAAYINSGLFNQASQIREQERQGGSTWGKFLGDMVQMIPWGKKQAPGMGLPNMMIGF
jgi:hypothetical protein